MAKHAILSDIHANLEALLAVYRDIAKFEGLRSVCSLGDIVGYGPNPTEVISGLNSLAKKGYAVRYCMGNHDAAAVGRFEFVDIHDPRDLETLAEAGFGDIEAVARQYMDPQKRKYVPVTHNAKASHVWTRQRLTEPFRQFILQQSQEHLFLATGVLCVHASPRDPLFDYITTARRAQRALEAPLMTGVGLCFIGHSHLPGIWQLGGDQIVRYAGNVLIMRPPAFLPPTRAALDLETTITLVNVGSVGQSRDGDPRACYVVYDDAAQTVEFRRVAYDIAVTRQKILKSGLPENLAERLTAGSAERGVAEPEGEE
jgi:diadenosine tetraphosphatase ApaH/serine/threonine PP2A family protein phosphatase